MGSRVLTACSFRSKSIPQQVFHRCRSAEALRLFRVPAVYLTSAFLWFFSILLFRRINNLRRINPPEGFDSHPGHHVLKYLRRIEQPRESLISRQITLTLPRRSVLRQMSGNPTYRELARRCQGRLLVVSGFHNSYSANEAVCRKRVRFTSHK